MGKLAAIQFTSSTQVKLRLFALILILSSLSSGCRGPWFKKTDNFEPLMVTEKPEPRSPRAFASSRLRPSSAAESQATAPQPGARFGSTKRQISDETSGSLSDNSAPNNSALDEIAEEVPDDGTLTPEQRAIFQKQMAVMQNAAIKNKVTRDLLAGNEGSPDPVTAASATDDSSRTHFSISDDSGTADSESAHTAANSAADTNTMPAYGKPVHPLSRDGERAAKFNQMAATEIPSGTPVAGAKVAGNPANNPKAQAPAKDQFAQRAPNTKQPATRNPAGASSADSAVEPASGTVSINDLDNRNATQGGSNPTTFGNEAPPADYRLSTQEAILALQAKLDNGGTLSPSQKLELEGKIRLLNVVLDDLEGAMTPIEFLAPDERDYFVHQFQALNAILDPQGNPVINRRWTIALQSQRKATTHAAALSNLEVQNVAFCTEVDSFGIISKFPQYHFSPNQELLLYCELDNFVAEKLKNEYETKLQGSYEIVDSNGRRVADQMLPPDTHVCNNQRRDYFIAYRMYMPQDIAPGRYSLKLTIEDMKGHKFGQSSVDFQILK